MKKPGKGRPPLDPSDPSVHLHFSIPSKGYDQLYRLARDQNITVPEVIRRAVYQAARKPKSTS